MNTYPTIMLFSIPSTLTTGHFNEHFIQNSPCAFIFLIPLTNQQPCVKLLHYVKGKKVKEQSFFIYKGNTILLRYLFFYLYYLYTVFFILPNKTVIFTTTPQYCMLSGLFRRLKHIEIIYHVGDYYANATGIMKLFSYLTFYYNKHLPYVVYCSAAVKKIYHTHIKAINGNRDYWVFGIKKQKLHRKVKKNLLGYIGVLREGQGLPIILDALIKNPSLSLEIIGDGSMLSALKKDVQKKGLSKRVHFFGLVQSESKVREIVSCWEMGLAPYDPSTANMTYYSEPSKIKFYLEHQLPIVMTKITHMYTQIEKYEAGVTIAYNTSDLLTAIVKIQKKYTRMIRGVERLAQEYEYNALYNRSFKFLTTIFKES